MRIVFSQVLLYSEHLSPANCPSPFCSPQGRSGCSFSPGISSPHLPLFLLLCVYPHVHVEATHESQELSTLLPSVLHAWHFASLLEI